MLFACHIDVLVNVQGLLAHGLARGRIIETRITFLVFSLEGFDVLGDLGSNGSDVADFRKINTVMDVVERF